MIRYLILGVFILMILIPTIILLFYYDNIKKNDLYMAFNIGSIVTGVLIILVYFIVYFLLERKENNESMVDKLIDENNSNSNFDAFGRRGAVSNFS